ncbi:hypothetical protein [Haloferax sp. DFSO52]|uniref:DUF7504 family protein n=1 Tax=Haloferax sp. DFSO52 TaxID=3388505 RepID=UPI003A85F374
MNAESISLNGETPWSLLVLGNDIDSPSLGLERVQKPRLLAVDFTPRSTGDPGHWENRLGTWPTELVVVTTETRDPDAVAADEVEQVNSPADLTGLGMKATKHLARWESNAETDFDLESKSTLQSEVTTPIVVFDSLTILLQYASVQSVFKFLHTLTTRISNVDGHGVFFLDPVTQDDKTVHTFAAVFDAVARRSGDEWDIESR